MIKKRLGLLALVVVTAALVWALPAAAQQGEAQGDDGHRDGRNADGVQVQAVEACPSRPASVTFEVTNKGNLPHDFKIAGKKTTLLQTGQDGQTLEDHASRRRARTRTSAPSPATPRPA